LISVSRLSRRYGAHIAVDDVSFEVGKGEVVGFLGPNGAGKSTTLRILAGFLAPTGGTVRIGGHDVVADSVGARRCVGYLPETAPLYPEMRVVEFLRFRAELKRVPRPLRRSSIDDAMAKAGVLDVAHKRIAHLSKGYRQRVGLADAIVARPPIVILDEPTAGLDPNQIREARQLVRELGREHTVVLSTHILSEVEACATRVLLIHRGKLLAEGPTATIRSMRAASAIELVVRGDATAAERTLRAVDRVARVARAGPDAKGTDANTDVRTPDRREGTDANTDVSRLRVTFAKELPDLERGRVIEACVAALVAAGLGVREARAAEGTLEDVFAALTHEGGGA
jgi:ABC-2 type transport system ATP-binding protein